MTAFAHICEQMAWPGWGQCPGCGAERVTCTDCGADLTVHR